MDASDADIEHAADVVAHHLGGDGGFLGDGEVGGAGAEDEDAVVFGGGCALDGEAACGFMVAGIGDGREDGGGGFGGDAGDEEAVGALEDGLRDAGDLGGGLALAEDDLGDPVAEGAVVVDLREADIYVGEIP